MSSLKLSGSPAGICRTDNSSTSLFGPSCNQTRAYSICSLEYWDNVSLSSLSPTLESLFSDELSLTGSSGETSFTTSVSDSSNSLVDVLSSFLVVSSSVDFKTELFSEESSVFFWKCDSFVTDYQLLMQIHRMNHKQKIRLTKRLIKMQHKKIVSFHFYDSNLLEACYLYHSNITKITFLT